MHTFTVLFGYSISASVICGAVHPVSLVCSLVAHVFPSGGAGLRMERHPAVVEPRRNLLHSRNHSSRLQRSFAIDLAK